MWRLMHTYHQIKLTHERRHRREADREEKEEADSKFSRNYVRTKLENGLLRVWRVRAAWICNRHANSVTTLGCYELASSFESSL